MTVFLFLLGIGIFGSICWHVLYYIYLCLVCCLPVLDNRDDDLDFSY